MLYLMNTYVLLVYDLGRLNMISEDNNAVTLLKIFDCPIWKHEEGEQMKEVAGFSVETGSFGSSEWLGTMRCDFAVRFIALETR